jgi:hypothetical protein
MGPWSGGKSSTLNYLLGTEYTKNAFKAGNSFEMTKLSRFAKSFGPGNTKGEVLLNC